MEIMRLKQLKYLEKIVEKGSINVAAKELFLSQPSLSNAIKDLEEEMGIQILIRHKSGVTLTTEGREFLVYARQVLDQIDLLDEKYKNSKPRKSIFSVSAQHYAFVVKAFVDLVSQAKTSEYQFNLRETATQNILDDLTLFKSELGIIYLNNFNRQVMLNIFKKQKLNFVPLFEARPHVFVSRDNPITKLDKVRLEDLTDLPYLSYEQGEENSFYFSEEILSTQSHKKEIKVTDRATIFNLMVGINGYTISTGIISRELNDDKIVALPLEIEDTIVIGYLHSQQLELSHMAQVYLEFLREHIEEYGFKILDENARQKQLELVKAV